MADCGQLCASYFADLADLAASENGAGEFGLLVRGNVVSANSMQPSTRYLAPNKERKQALTTQYLISMHRNACYVALSIASGFHKMLQ